MRKIISMSVMALLLSMMASTAMAGNVEDCEILKDGDYSKGLYGLCIAWHNAGSDNARDRILDNYNKKAGPDDPVMPGTEDQDLCPCWDDSVMANAADNGVLNSEGCLSIPDAPLEIEFAVYDHTGLPPGIFAFQVENFGCFYQDPFGGGQMFDFTAETPANVIQRCRDDIEIMCGL